ncbi:BZ3500_MvSof-1268-A1-R1_Chr1-3g02424 [Microbotryum saponariae]|uniref:BZ3500_MvSof-1268-A1-R1_Chr1-3g02424 protein n=1 Tax=Microbotryum saponariae TaxID=289078 RepID=A0A2X0KXB1_9BASI|nr:BZ3500_MvSof-1268-A1-R1_Chr1-3g02424 [Microbotryum saponariae]SCZ96211.1 BZ3501_MvSof-1269-A2-R1_Chr1-3g02027 [Microbotryum saponariae]
MTDHIPSGTAHEHDGHLRVTYNDIHMTIGKTAHKIKSEFNPDLFIAIGGGGFFPARVLRTFLKQGAAGEKKRNIPIQAIGLSLYEEVGAFDGSSGLAQAEKLGKEVVRTQWLDFSTLGNQPLLGRKILIVDEVDDSRTTLSYAVQELRKDIDAQLAALSEEKKAEFEETQLAIFVVHNKLKEKRGTLPKDVQYFSGEDIADRWVDYPWEQQDILLHEQVAAKQKALGL